MSSAFSTPVALDRLVLTGFMGSGKSTVGRLLAQRLGWSFLDLDHETERLVGRTVPQIFAESGEASFRKLEHDTLVGLLERKQIVLALGGGALESASSQTLLTDHARTAVLYLAAPFAILMERCRAQAAQPGYTERPVLSDLEAAERRFHSRHKVYELVAKHMVETSRQDADQTVTAILKMIQGLC